MELRKESGWDYTMVVEAEALPLQCAAALHKVSLLAPHSESLAVSRPVKVMLVVQCYCYCITDLHYSCVTCYSHTTERLVSPV